MAGYRGFSKLPSSPYGCENTPTSAPERVPFSKFELCVLIPFTVLDAVLGISSAIYIVKHSGTIKPLAIALLCTSGILLIVIAFVAVYRARRAGGCGDLESSMGQNQQLSSTKTAKAQETGYIHLKEEAYTTAESRPSPTYSPTLAFKVYYAVRRAFSPSLPPRRMFETLSDKEQLLFQSETKFRLDDDNGDDDSVRSSDDRRRSGLWTSVFELAGDARLDQFRLATLKRFSKESRRSRYEMCADGDLPPSIVITKPEPTASPPRSRRGSRDFRHPGEAPLSFDPLRSHPFQVRESTLQQSKSLKDLKLLSANPIKRPSSRRSRSADPTPPDQSRLDSDQSIPQSKDRGKTQKPKMLSVIILTSATPTYETKPPSGYQLPRNLRKLPSPGKEGHSLRKAFSEGI